MKVRLEPLGENIWTVAAVQKFLGVDFGSRMTVIRLSSGELFLHSPVKLNEELVSELKRLGEVKYLIAPNKFHHLHIGDYISIFPEAEVWGAPGLAKKRSDIKFAGEFGEGAAPTWEGEIEQVLFEGIPFINEVVFYHPGSKTLIFTDLIFNVGADESLGVKFYAWIDGVYSKPGVSRLIKLMVKDRGKVNKSVVEILSWDFDYVSCAHRNIIRSGGKEAISKALNGI